MKTEWTKGVQDAQLVLDIKGNFKGSIVIRNRLSKMLNSKIDAAYRQSRSKEGYDSPNWAYKQADTQGYNRALSEIISLLIEK